MPSTINIKGEWKYVPVPGSISEDKDFEFFGTLEEISAEKFFRSRKPHVKRGEILTVKQRKKMPMESQSKSPQTTSKAFHSKKPPECKNDLKALKKWKKQTRKLRKRLISGSIRTSTVVNVPEDERSSDVKKKKRRIDTSAREESVLTENRSKSSDRSRKDSFSNDEQQRKVKKTMHRTKIKESKDDGNGQTVSSEGTMKIVRDESELAVDEDAISNWIEYALPSQINKAIAKLGFKEPTEIQRLVLPSAVRDKLDIFGAAETGSGKTLAYAIPVVVRLLEWIESSKVPTSASVGPAAVVLCPTRELVIQVKRHIQEIAKYTSLKIASVVGGLSQQKQERLLKLKPHIIVATPGRLWALIESANPGTFLSNWSMLQVLVIDETDRMVEKGHFEELRYILDKIKIAKTNKLQTLVFSATLTFVHPAPRRLGVIQSADMTKEEKIDEISDFIGMRKERKVFDITRSFGTAEAIVESRMNCRDLLEKDTNVVYLLTRYPGRTLIFTNSVDASRRLHRILTKLNCDVKVGLIHAKMMQKARMKNLEQFTENPNSVLLATDVAARGLDIKGVEHVIHYQVPKTAELYVHRSGRTARASEKGVAVLMLDEKDAQFYRRICRNLNRDKDMQIFPIDNPKLHDVLKNRVELATKLESLEFRLKKISSREKWFERAAREADLIFDDRDRAHEESSELLEQLKREKKTTELSLNHSLSMPLPKFDRTTIRKSRYVTPQMIADYSTPLASDAISSIEEFAKIETSDRKKVRKILSGRHLKNLKRNRKQKKLVRK